MAHRLKAPEQLNILLVEDDDGDAEAIYRAFKSARIANPIQRVRDGVECLDLLQGRTAQSAPSPVILLVDINMPRMNGHELVSALRQDQTLRQHVIFMLSTSDDPADVGMAYNNNVAGYIVKQRAGLDFLRLMESLESYWRVVELPRIA